MRALTSNDVARIRELTDALFEIAEEVGLDMGIDVKAGDKNGYKKAIEIYRANGYRDLDNKRAIPGRVDIYTRMDNGETDCVATSNDDEREWFSIDDGDYNGHIAALFEEVRNEIIEVGRRAS